MFSCVRGPLLFMATTWSPEHLPLHLQLPSGQVNRSGAARGPEQVLPRALARACEHEPPPEVRRTGGERPTGRCEPNYTSDATGGAGSRGVETRLRVRGAPPGALLQRQERARVGSTKLPEHQMSESL
jgi:hypothetical protein